MFLLVKEIDGDKIIIGTAHKRVSAESSMTAGVEVFEIPDDEYDPKMIHAKIESFDEEQ